MKIESETRDDWIDLDGRDLFHSSDACDGCFVPSSCTEKQRALWLDDVVRQLVVRNPRPEP